MRIYMPLALMAILSKCTSVFCQTTLNIIPPSPESSQIHRFDLYAVDLFTGATEVSVPIYSINADGIEIPITLKYQTSGIKLEDESGSVGLGWSLIAGGRISRTIRGSADEWGIFEARQEGDIEYLSHNASPDTILEDYYNYFYNLDQGTRDSEQDLFYYSTPTVNGRFILNETSHQVFNCTTVPFRPVRWNYGIENNTPKFTYFEITDENGTYFRFGKSLINPSNMNSEVTSAPAVPTTWLLSEIITMDKSDTIQFAYKTRNSIVPNWYGRWIPNDYAQTVDYGYEGGVPTSEPYLNFSFGYDAEQIKSHRRIDYQRVMLDKILFKNGKIEFSSDANSVMIKAIRIYNKVNGVYKLIREVILNYNTFPGKEHYTLNEAVFNDSKSDKAYSYSFDYNNEGEPFPSVSEARGIDWWGYYNGLDDNTYLYPSTELLLMTHYGSPAHHTLSGGNRTANDNAKHSILTDIFLPTGGRTHFEYEGNFYDNGWLFNRAGGLRIKSIANYSDKDDLLYIKKYKYGPSESGYGISLVEPRPEYYKTESTFFYLDKGELSNLNYSYRQTKVSSSPTVDLNYSQQPSVVYPYVTEYLLNGQMEQLGKTEYIFSFNEEGLVQEDIIRPMSHNPFLHSYYKAEIRDWGQEGKLLEKTVFKQDGSLYVPVQKTKFSYDTFNIAEYHNLIVRPYGSWETELERLRFNLYYINTYSTGGYYQTYRDFCKFAWAFGDQKIITGATRMSNKVTYEYDSDGNPTLKDRIKYKYNNRNHLFVSETVTYKSSGDSVITADSYPQDYPTGIETSIAVIDTMISRNILSSLLKRENKLNGTTFISGTINGFKLDENNVVPSELQIAGNNGIYERRIQYHNHDESGNLLKVSTDGNYTTSYLWGYKQSLPVAKIDNAANGETMIYEQEKVEDVQTSVDYSWEGGSSFPMFNVVESPKTQSIIITYAFAKENPEDDGSYSMYFSIGPYSSGSVTLGTGEFYKDGSVTISNVPAGTYDFTVHKDYETTVNGELYYEKRVVTITQTYGRTKEVFHENFEENVQRISSATAHTGNYVYKGSFDIDLRDKIAGEYTLMYWSSIDGMNWLQHDEVITVTPFSTSHTVGNSSSFLDDIRLHPVDAMMTTYTYAPLIGMTSKTDPSGITVYYEYDDFERLNTIRDGERNILEQYEYKYVSGLE